MIDLAIWQGHLSPVIGLHHQHQAGDRRFQPEMPTGERPRSRPTRLCTLAVIPIDPGARVTDIFLSYNCEDQARAKRSAINTFLIFFEVLRVRNLHLSECF